MDEFLTEDVVRDSMAKPTLGFDDNEKDVVQGTGQVTTFSQLGIKGYNNKPDGWYLPKNTALPAIILETKNSLEDLTKKKWVDELLENIDIAETRYKQVIGILYNGISIRVFKSHEEILGLSQNMEHKKYYLALYTETHIDKNLIYTLTARINNCLHVSFGIKNLYHRMIFTACALVAVKEGAFLHKGMDYNTFHQSILSQLNKSLTKAPVRNAKLSLLTDVYSEIKMNRSDNQDAIDNFIDWVQQISNHINSNEWHGEDVMGIFFNEFNRYKPKSEAGQVFTPDHITDFMYRILDVTKEDRVLDAACGSGGFLVKAMANMIYEAGGQGTKKAKDIKANQLFGIEFDREIFALVCANMLIHKDGKTNLEQLDATSDEACSWISTKHITKVMMNPPFEQKYGCTRIVYNVLNSVPTGTLCAFILPDKKLEKASGKGIGRTKTGCPVNASGDTILKRHKLLKIIKLPENLFFGVGVTTSIFIFEAGKPQNNQEIFACYMEDDGLETVKNQGRHDVRGRWQAIEDYWVDVMHKQKDEKYHTDQWIKPSEHLSYQMPEKPFEIHEEDFMKAAMDYLLFKKGIDVDSLGSKIREASLYGSTVVAKDGTVTITMKGDRDNED